MNESKDTGGRRWGLNRIDDLPKKPGVYVLFKNGKRVYVGETLNLQNSLRQHLLDSDEFTNFTWYNTTESYRFGLAKRLKKNYRKELEES